MPLTTHTIKLWIKHALMACLLLTALGNAQVSSLPTGVTTETFYDTTKAGLSFRKDKLSVMGMSEVPGHPMHFLVLGYFGFVWSLYPNPSQTINPTGMMNYSRKQLADFNNVTMKGWEQGAMGATFDPKFKENRNFYIIYNKYKNPAHYKTGVVPVPSQGDGAGTAGWVVIERWKLSEDLTKLTRDTTILTMDRGTGYGTSNMVFGKDGYLYISTSSYSKNSWDSTEIMRKVLRIDVSKQDPGKLYAIPPTNPWYNATNPAVKKEVFAFGFRNSYSLVANYLTGSILGAEVGQKTWEEVNIIQAGKNYGWADGGDGQSNNSHGKGVQGPCSENTASGTAFNEQLRSPYSYSGPISMGQKYTCNDFTNGSWNFAHAGQNLGGSKTAVPGLQINCIIMSPAFRGSPTSPFHGHHFVTDINRAWFVAIKEGDSDAKQVGGLPNSYWREKTDLNHNGPTSFAEDSYGNLYVTLVSSRNTGALDWHDPLRLKHPQMQPLAQPREQVLPTSGSTKIAPIGLHGFSRNTDFQPFVVNYAGLARISMPEGATRVELFSLEGKRVWSQTAMAGTDMPVPRSVNPGAFWVRFLP